LCAGARLARRDEHQNEDEGHQSAHTRRNITSRSTRMKTSETRVMRLSVAICLAALFTGSGRNDVRARPSGQTPVRQRPNIGLSIADDWSFPHARVYGDSTVSTPTLHR